MNDVSRRKLFGLLAAAPVAVPVIAKSAAGEVVADTGIYNTAIGPSALGGQSAGTNNIILGFNTGSYAGGHHPHFNIMPEQDAARENQGEGT